MNLDQRSAGVLAHITSLPGPHGIGDFGPNAYYFVDWLQSAGQSIWQWLPTTPIGPGNSPYQSVSAFAGSPLMVALEPLVKSGWLMAPVLPESGFDDYRVDFDKVVTWRLTQLRWAADGFRAHASTQEKEAFNAWCSAQTDWLEDYALFLALETAYGRKRWWHWPEDLRQRKPKAVARAKQMHADEVYFLSLIHI